MSMPTHPAKAIGWNVSPAYPMLFAISLNSGGNCSSSAVPWTCWMFTGENVSPIVTTIIDTIRPTSGPDMPTSKSAFLLCIGPRCLITAPMVPIGGRGMGYEVGQACSHAVSFCCDVMCHFMGSKDGHYCNGERKSYVDEVRVSCQVHSEHDRSHHHCCENCSYCKQNV